MFVESAAMETRDFAMSGYVPDSHAAQSGATTN
jgi:hypothetical protein